ncbi:hypothetical protein M947_09055 [Sulfurimonas hongkongensis]|uniref:Uncharacterized protein n=1 Tax=Sulfurimonas hongkongensis TaxID=1172190 RepID=T0J2Z4_9BACT|nr:hypothetical protein [Sulfurimonas hongkongensis]EQB35420.1 hypothetical protein M947_09055 [Sulfurimonas hongkongensis]
MLNDDYVVLKNSFIESQRLFDKLNIVANQAKEIEYDESGLFYEDEERVQRHWLKLSSKIVDALSHDLDSYKVELLKNEDLEARELSINLIKDGEISKILVDYSRDGAINITQIS